VILLPCTTTGIPVFIFYFLLFFESIYNKKSKIAFQRRQKNIQRGSFNVSAKVHYCVREKSLRAKLSKI